MAVSPVFALGGVGALILFFVDVSGLVEAGEPQTELQVGGMMSPVELQSIGALHHEIPADIGVNGGARLAAAEIGMAAVLGIVAQLNWRPKPRPTMMGGVLSTLGTRMACLILLTPVDEVRTLIGAVGAIAGLCWAPGLPGQC